MVLLNTGILELAESYRMFMECWFMEELLEGGCLKRLSRSATVNNFDKYTQIFSKVLSDNILS